MKSHRAALAAVCLLLLTSPSFAIDALMGGLDARHSNFTPEKVQFPLALKWEFTGNKYKGNPASPIVAGNTCYFACGDYVYAVDLGTGEAKWKYPTDRGLGGSVKSTPAYYDGSLFFGAGDKNLYCLNAATGTYQWAFAVRGSIRCAPLILDGLVYFGADDDSIYCISAETGDSKWAKPFTAKDDIAGNLAINSGLLVASSMDGCMYGLISNNGSLRTMPFRLPEAPTRTSPIIVENMAVMAIGNSVLGLTLRSNQLRWQITLPSEVAANPAASGNDIFVPCRDKKIYAYNIGGRKPVLKWTEPADLGAVPMSSPTVADQTVFVTGSKGVVAAFSAEDGTLLWRYVCSPSAITAAGSASVDASSSPVVANGAVLVLTDDGVLHCFSANAADQEPPKTFGVTPSMGSVLSSAPPIKMSCVLYDLGSGVDFSKVSMLLDGQPVSDPKIDASAFTISYTTEIGGSGKPMQKLPQGAHTVTVNAQDYKGNTLSYSWFFLTDDTLPPPKVTVPEPKKTTVQPPKRRQPTAGAPGDWPELSGDQGAVPPPPPPPPAPAGKPGTF
jgi:outer membrane protein assembly factor BamB